MLCQLDGLHARQMQDSRLGYWIQRTAFLRHLGSDAGDVNHGRLLGGLQQGDRFGNQPGATDDIDIETRLPGIPRRVYPLVVIAHGIVDHPVQVTEVFLRQADQLP